MRFDNLKDAFGSTPESIKECVRRSLREEQRREPVMKRKMTVSMAVALAAIMLIGCVGFAATQPDGIAGIFGFTNYKTGETIVNEAVMKHIEALNEGYEGKTVRFTLTEGMYSPENQWISVSWVLEPLTEGEQYYVLCSGAVGGSLLEGGMQGNVSEYLLKSATESVLLGQLTGENLMTELKFSILKIKGEPVRVYHGDEESYDEFFTRMEALIAEGKLPMAGDGVIEVRPSRDLTYAEELVRAGAAELAEEFTVTFDLGQINPIDEKRTYEGEKNFVFEGFEIQIGEVVVTPADSRIRFDYISDTQLTEEETDTLMVGSNVTVPGMDTWMKAAYTKSEDPVQTEDGRWKVSFVYEVTLQVVYPEELVLSLARYDADGNPTPLIGEGILLKLTDAAEK